MKTVKFTCKRCGNNLGSGHALSNHYKEHPDHAPREWRSKFPELVVAHQSAQAVTAAASKAVVPPPDMLWQPTPEREPVAYMPERVVAMSMTEDGKMALKIEQTTVRTVKVDLTSEIAQRVLLAVANGGGVKVALGSELHIAPALAMANSGGFPVAGTTSIPMKASSRRQGSAKSHQGRTHRKLTPSEIGIFGGRVRGIKFKMARELSATRGAEKRALVVAKAETELARLRRDFFADKKI